MVTNNPKISVAQQTKVCVSFCATSPRRLEENFAHFGFSGTQANGDFTLTCFHDHHSCRNVITLTGPLHLPSRSDICLFCLHFIGQSQSHELYLIEERTDNTILPCIWEAESWKNLSISVDGY